ncbi:DUF262 domain-containing protein [Pannus brasiliensis CCIBt3594]|uniref:DUF262 domain-containing protein n=1 Tax=Pannus brasiliensis CCIBt3594 TaxID=1427578 RepID=A0AAW9QJJ9_9CHRO
MSDEEQSRFTEEQVSAAEEQIVEQSKRIEFYLTEFSVELLASKMENGDFEVPLYQRDDTWEDSRKSRFIESLLMGLPIPFLFFWENPNTGKLEIVDGSQRLRTIQQFILGDRVIGELEELSRVSGFRFKDLPESRQRKIKNRSIRGIVLNEHADEQSRFELFDRINTGSKIANTAEVRRGILNGAFQDLVISLSNEEFFKALAPVTKKQDKEREREELVTRFFAYGDGLDDYKDRVSAFLFDYTKKMNLEFKNNLNLENVYRQKFINTMEFVSKNFPCGFRKTAKGNVTPRARFEAIAIGSYRAIQERPQLINQVKEVRDWLGSKEFVAVTGADGANVKKRLNARIDFVRNKLLED